MDRQKWTLWQDQGQWHGHPAGSPDRRIQAASFDELQFRVGQLSQDVVKSPREIPRIAQPHAGSPAAETLTTDPGRYVLSQEQGKWRGYLQGYPNHVAQGESFDEVQFKLWKIYGDLINGKSSSLRKAA